MISTTRAVLLVAYLAIGVVFAALAAWIFVVPMAMGFFFLVPAVRRDLAAEAAEDAAELERFRRSRRGRAADDVWHLPGGREVVAVPLTGPVPREAESEREPASRGPVETEFIRLTGPPIDRERPSAVRLVVLHGRRVEDRHAAAEAA